LAVSLSAGLAACPTASSRPGRLLTWIALSLITLSLIALALITPWRPAVWAWRPGKPGIAAARPDSRLAAVRPAGARFAPGGIGHMCFGC
jgi:hypothetical protein